MARQARQRQAIACEAIAGTAAVQAATGLAAHELRGVVFFLRTHFVLPHAPWGRPPAPDDVEGLATYAHAVFAHFVSGRLRDDAVRRHASVAATLAIEIMTGLLPGRSRARYGEELHAELHALSDAGLGKLAQAGYLVRQATCVLRTRRELTTHSAGGRP